MEKKNRLLWYLILVVLLSVFCFITLQVWLFPYSAAYNETGAITPGYLHFCTDIFEGEMAHARFYDEEIRKQIPKCHHRKYTIIEIINFIIVNGFILERFDEHPAWENDKLPGEFTAIAKKG